MMASGDWPWPSSQDRVLHQAQAERIRHFGRAPTNNHSVNGALLQTARPWRSPSRDDDHLAGHGRLPQSELKHYNMRERRPCRVSLGRIVEP